MSETGVHANEKLVGSGIVGQVVNLVIGLLAVVVEVASGHAS